GLNTISLAKRAYFGSGEPCSVRTRRGFCATFHSCKLPSLGATATSGARGDQARASTAFGGSACTGTVKADSCFNVETEKTPTCRAWSRMANERESPETASGGVPGTGKAESSATLNANDRPKRRVFDRSHAKMAPSRLHVYAVRPSAENVSPSTRSSWPVNVSTTCAVRGFHTV